MAEVIAVSYTYRATGESLPEDLVEVNEITVGPSGWSTKRCKNGHFLPDSYPATSAHWSKCQCGLPRDDNQFAVRHASIQLMTNSHHADQAIWWHASTSPDLFVNDQDLLMHWGEFDTTMHHYLRRIKGNSRARDRVLYLYSAMLTRGVGRNVFIENLDLVQQHTELVMAYDEQGPTRYLNLREAPGSISLVARKGDFTPHQGYDISQTDDSVIKLP